MSDTPWLSTRLGAFVQGVNLWHGAGFNAPAALQLGREERLFYLRRQKETTSAFPLQHTVPAVPGHSGFSVSAAKEMNIFGNLKVACRCADVGQLTGG